MGGNGKTGQGKPKGEVVAIRDEALGLFMIAAIGHGRQLPHESVQKIVHLARNTVRYKVSGLSPADAASFRRTLDAIDDFVAVFDSRMEDAGLS